jgi:hypothetical protein
MPTIPIELYHHVISFIPCNERDTLITLSITSQAFNYAAERILYREVRLDQPWDHLEECYTFLDSVTHSQRNRTSYVRSLYIYFDDKLSKDTIATYGSSLAKVINQLSNLRELHWRHPFLSDYDGMTGRCASTIFSPSANSDSWRGRGGSLQLERLSWDRLHTGDSELFYTFLTSQKHLTHLSLSTSHVWDPDSWEGFHPIPMLSTIQSLVADSFDAPVFLLHCPNVTSFTLAAGLQLPCFAGISSEELDKMHPSFRRLKNFTLQIFDDHGVQEIFSGEVNLATILPLLENLGSLCLQLGERIYLEDVESELNDVDWSLVRSPHFWRIRILGDAMQVGRPK